MHQNLDFFLLKLHEITEVWVKTISSLGLEVYPQIGKDPAQDWFCIQ